ncbi:o-acyltransferase [Anaeramoeba flamelloides]|uniref:O-acyltransferase n=1 Tax=Anaeramoeba flamelloides TaxID=1746091 RepID=A0AAV7YC63_9EUKA|nr:o-acyltransferase [Anaeramoeba flamelloides]
MGRILSAFNPIRNFKTIFRRPSNNHINSFDGVRALSSQYMVLYHCLVFLIWTLPKEIIGDFTGKPYSKLISCGDVAVDFFFYLSGYLVMLRFLKEEEKEKEKEKRSEKKGEKGEKTGSKLGYDFNFFARRLLRLYPLLYFYVFFKVLQLMPFNINHAGLIKAILSLVFFYNDYTAPTMYQPAMHGWSVAVEMKTYAVFLFIRRLMKKKINALKVLICFVVGFSLISFAVSIYVPKFFTYNILTCFVPDLWYNMIDPYETDFQKSIDADGAFWATDAGRDAHIQLSGLYYGTHLRIIVMLVGAIFAYIQERSKLSVSLKKSPLYRIAFLIGSLVLFASYFALKASNLMDTIDFTETSPLFNVLFRLIIFNRSVLSVGFGGMLFLIINKIGLFGNIFNYLFSNKLWVPFSNLSYSLYMAHPLAIFIITIEHAKNITENGFEIILFVKYVTTAFITSYIISLFLYLFIERPFINLSPKRTQADSTLEKEKKIK